MKILVDELPEYKENCCFYAGGSCRARPIGEIAFVCPRCVDVGNNKCPLLALKDHCNLYYLTEGDKQSVILKVGNVIIESLELP